MPNYIFEDGYYKELRDALKQDPIINKMMSDLVMGRMSIDQITNDDKTTPEWSFVVIALEEYRRRAGENAIESHIGGPAEAIIELMKGV